MNSTTKSKPVAGVVAAIIVGVLAVGGVAAAVVLMLGPTHVPAGSAGGGSSSHSSTHSSAVVKLVQEELAQLNYYEGPIDGHLNAETVKAITYLQRDAGLPQTGQLNEATRAALTTMVQNGNNQMG